MNFCCFIRIGWRVSLYRKKPANFVHIWYDISYSFPPIKRDINCVSTKGYRCLHTAMGCKWGSFGLWLRLYIGLVSLWEIRQCWSLNDEGDFHRLPFYRLQYESIMWCNCNDNAFLVSWCKIVVVVVFGTEPAGFALLEFRVRITSDPYGALANWNPNDSNPCKWLGVHCVDDKVQML